MEKLSIEEKDYNGNYKAYTELINRLENVKDAIKKQNYGIAMDILCKPYPEFQITTSTELKESDDIMIKKALIEHFRWNTKQILNEFSNKKVLAWLEKQCEKTEPIEYFDTEFERQVSHLVASAINREYEYNKGYVKWAAQSLIEYAKREIEKQGEQKLNPVLGIEIPFGANDSELQEASYYIPEGFHAEIEGNKVVIKRGEQKPNTQHSTEWSISDFRTWQYIVSDVLTKKDGIGQYLDSGECKKIAKYMQEEWGGKLGKEQTQEELRKGENYGIDGLYHAISILEKTLSKVDGYQTDDGILEHKCAISAVKSLYEQKSAWSEEDEEKMNWIIATLNNCSMRNSESLPMNESCEDWLKSLRPQNTWKPSDEQMSALSKAIAFVFDSNSDVKHSLESLYNELKKL